MFLKRILAVSVSAVMLAGCVSQATQQALTAAQQACSIDLARGWTMASPSCQQFYFLQAQAERERSESGQMAAGLLGAALAVGTVAAVASGPGGGPGPGPRAPRVIGGGGGGGPRPGPGPGPGPRPPPR